MLFFCNFRRDLFPGTLLLSLWTDTGGVSTEDSRGGVTLKPLPKENDNDYPEDEMRKSCSTVKVVNDKQRNGYPFMVFLQAFEDNDKLFLKR